MSLVVDPYRFAAAASAPTFVSAYSTGNNTSPQTVNVPSGVADGDFMLFALHSITAATVTAPGGWTHLATYTGGTALLHIYYRVASSEPASYSWSVSASTFRQVCVAYRGTSGIDVYNGQANASSTNVDAPSITTTVDNCMVVSLGRADAVSSWTPATGFTLRNQSPTSGNFPNGAWDKVYAAAGATGTVTHTIGSATTNLHALVALKP